MAFILSPSIRYALIALIYSFSAKAEGPINTQTECREYQAPIKWSACITQPTKNKSSDILYFLHGSGGSEHSWVSSRSLAVEVRKYWEEKGSKQPTVVAISFGKQWILAEKNKSSMSGLFEIFTKQLIPLIEEKLGGLQGKRLLFGISMGGFNASQLVLKNPELLSKAVLACPALSPISPYSPLSKIRKYIKETHADNEKVLSSLALVKFYYPDEKSWKSASPLELGKKFFNKNSPELLVSCGHDDEYGFALGSQLFAKIAKQMGVKKATWIEVEGKHCAFDSKAVANFLVD